MPELTFDIYGEGSEKTRLRQIINEHHAESYIRILGHVNLEKFMRIMNYFFQLQQVKDLVLL